MSAPLFAHTPASPNQNGKVERFHGTFRPDFLTVADPLTSIELAQAAADAARQRGWRDYLFEVVPLAEHRNDPRRA